MANFEEALLDQLKRHEPAPTVPVRLDRSRKVAAAAFAAAAALAVSAMFLPSLNDTAPPAYAVTTNPDGTVTLTLDELNDFAGATKALQAAGINAVVLDAYSENCADPWKATVPFPHDLLDTKRSGYRVLLEGGRIGNRVLTLRPGVLRPGTVLVITPQRFGPGFGVGLEPAPSCVEGVR